MKKIFSLAIALIAFVGVANAQDYDMTVELADGSSVTYHTRNVTDVIFGEEADPNEGWTSLGYCYFHENWFGDMYYMEEEGDLAEEYYVEVQKKDDGTAYRLVDPYGPAWPLSIYTENYTYDTWENHYYVELNVQYGEDEVYVELQDTGMSWDWGDLTDGPDPGRMWVYSYSSYYLDNGYSDTMVARYGYFGKFVDGVLTFPTFTSGRSSYGTLLVWFPDYAPTSYYYADTTQFWKLDLNDKSDTPGAKNAPARQNIPENLNVKKVTPQVATLKNLD